jgi:hypothetical protein
VPLENLEMFEGTEIILRSFSSPMLSPLTALFATLASVFRSRSALQLENLALRHQIGVLQRAARKRPKLTPGDRLLWVWLSRLWSGWRSALAIVKPETVIAWHRVGFRRFWTWKVRRGRPGRPVVAREVRDLIRRMCRENPSWGAPRVHGELLKLGIDIGETSVSKYMVRCRKPPSQTWLTFLENHVQQLLKLGIDIGETSVSKYMVRCRKPPSQTSRRSNYGSGNRGMRFPQLWSPSISSRCPPFASRFFTCFWCWLMIAGAFSIAM